MRTEQQNKLEALLKNIIAHAPKGSLIITFKTQAEIDKRDIDIKSCARKFGEKVELFLVEPQNRSNYDEWAEAMVTCEELLTEVEQERAHNLNSPNFFNAMRYMVSYQNGR